MATLDSGLGQDVQNLKVYLHEPARNHLPDDESCVQEKAALATLPATSGSLSAADLTQDYIETAWKHGLEHRHTEPGFGSPDASSCASSTVPDCHHGQPSSHPPSICSCWLGAPAL